MKMPVNRLSTCLILPAALAVAAGCSDRDTDTLEPATASSDPLVFGDNFGAFTTYQAFLNSLLTAVSVDNTVFRDGSGSLRVHVPGPDEITEDENFAGGAITTSNPRNLTEYNALTFYARSSIPSVLDVVGFGNDNTGFSLYQTELSGVELDDDWRRVIIPIPLPELLTLEGGLLWFAEGHEGTESHDFWMDEVQFESLSSISNPRPRMTTSSVNSFLGADLTLGSLDGVSFTTTFDVGGEDVTVGHFPGYFTFMSSDESVVSVNESTLAVMGEGQATITAMLGSTPVEGELTINSAVAPTEPAPAPTYAQPLVAIFSDAYPEHSQVNFNPDWDSATVSDFAVGGDNIKAYSSLAFAGMDFGGNVFDASALTHISIDVWVPANTQFKVKVVDFGPNGVFDMSGGDDSEHELSFVPSGGEWNTFNVSLDDFTGLTNRSSIAQVIISSLGGNAFVDNVIFHATTTGRP